MEDFQRIISIFRTIWTHHKSKSCSKSRKNLNIAATFYLVGFALCNGMLLHVLWAKVLLLNICYREYKEGEPWYVIAYCLPVSYGILAYTSLSQLASSQLVIYGHMLTPNVIPMICNAIQKRNSVKVSESINKAPKFAIFTEFFLS